MKLSLTNILKEYSTGIVNKLKQSYKQQNSALTDEQMMYYINRFDQLKSSPKVEQKDITKYSFQQLEQIVDSFPTKEKIQKQGGSNNVEFSQTELIYNQLPLQIYHGDSEKTCIKIKGDFPATWCISRSSGGNMYKNYRYQGQEPSFYFVKNLDKMNKIENLKDDKYCFFVVQYNNEGNYVVTSALNDGDKEMSWNNIVQLEPLLKGKESLFKHVPLTDDERKYYNKFKNGIDDEEYKELSYEEKKIYISITNSLNDEKFKNTPNDLINDYITTGVALTDGQLDFIKDKRQLFENYRRVTLNIVIPEYLKRNITFGNRWAVLTDEEAIDLYNKKDINFSFVIQYKPTLIKYFENRLDELNSGHIINILEVNPNLAKYFENEFKDFDGDDIQEIIMVQPQLIKYFEDKLKYIKKYNIKNILIYQPSLVKYFENDLSRITPYNVEEILKQQPQLIEYFKDTIKDFDTYNIQQTLKYQPSLIKYFKDRLGGMSGYDISTILLKQPSLANYFENYLDNLDKFDIEDLVKEQPKLKPYFEKKGLLNEYFKYPSLKTIVIKSFQNKK